MGAGEQMGNAITVSHDEVRVEKEFVEDEFPLPTIRLILRNEADVPRDVRLSEYVPDDYSTENMGFHPEYGSEYWTCYEDNHAEYDREVGPGEMVVTLYGLRLESDGDATAFMTEPALSTGLPDDDAAVPTDSSGPLDGGDVAAVDAEVDKELLDDEGGEGDEGDDGAVGDSAEPDESTSLEPAVTPIDSSADDGADADSDGEPVAGELSIESIDGDGSVTVPTTEAPPGPESGSLVDRLVEELRRTDVDADQKAVLREQLDLGVPSKTAARIERLQSRVETVAAYTDSLEAFLDEEGTAQAVIRDFETQVEALRGDVATLTRHTRSNASHVGALDENLTDLEAHVDDVEDRLDDVASDADGIERSLESTDERVESVERDLRDAEERIVDTADDVSELDQYVVELTGDLDDVEGRVSATESTVDELEDGLDDLDGEMDDVERRVRATDADVRALDDRTSAVESTVDDVESAVAENAEGVAENAEDVAENAEDVAENAEAVESVRTSLDDTDEAVDDIREDLADVEEGVEELTEWRSDLGEMFK